MFGVETVVPVAFFIMVAYTITGVTLPFRRDDPIMLGVILVSAAGLLTYYASAKRMARSSERGRAEPV